MTGIQIVINGTIQGFAFSLMGLSFGIVFTAVRIFHVAFAAVYTIPPYVFYAAIQSGIPVPVSIVLALISGTLVSMSCEIINHAPLRKSHASPDLHLVASLGFYIFVIQAIALYWGNEAKSLHVGAHPTYAFAGLVLVRSQVLIVAVSLVSVGLLAVIIKYTKIGLDLRALSDNPSQLSISGKNVSGLFYLVFGVSGFLASIASLLTSYDVGFDPYIGLQALMLAIVSATIGGRGTLAGPILGGIVLGILRSTTVWFTSPSWKDGITFALLALFLLFRPEGILGRTERLESDL